MAIFVPLVVGRDVFHDGARLRIDQDLVLRVALQDLHLEVDRAVLIFESRADSLAAGLLLGSGDSLCHADLGVRHDGGLVSLAVVVVSCIGCSGEAERACGEGGGQSHIAKFEGGHDYLLAVRSPKRAVRPCRGECNCAHYRRSTGTILFPNVGGGAANEQEIERSLATLKTVDNFRTGVDGLPHVADPNGISLAFRVSKRTPIAAKPTQPNAPGSQNRVNTRSPIHTQAHPIDIGHVVLFAADFAAMHAFYTERLGFAVSDEYPNHGVFMRCHKVGDHHNTFVMECTALTGTDRTVDAPAQYSKIIGDALTRRRNGIFVGG